MKQLILIIFILFTFNQSYSQSFENNFGDKNQISIDKKDSAADVSIFPNPVKQNKVTVKFNNHQIQEIRLTNILGKEVLIKKYQIPVQEERLEINDIVDGIYLIRIKTTDNQLFVKKLIVSRS